MKNRQIYKNTDFLQADKKGLFTGRKKDLLESVKNRGLSLHRSGTILQLYGS